MDYAEEQDMEIEALESIFDEDFSLISKSPYKFDVTLMPNPGGDDEENHVVLELNVTFPAKYPEEAPAIILSNKRGLKPIVIKSVLQKIVDDTVEEYMGEVMIFTITEALKDWMLDNNVKEATLYEQMEEQHRAEAAVEEAKQQEEEEKKRIQVEEEIAVANNPLGIDPTMITTTESFAWWLKEFTAEQEAKGTKKKIEAVSQHTGREIFEMNLAKELDDGDAEGKDSKDEVFWFNESIYDDDDPELDSDDDDDDDEDDDDDDEEDGGESDKEVAKIAPAVEKVAISEPKPEPKAQPKASAQGAASQSKGKKKRKPRKK